MMAWADHSTAAREHKPPTCSECGSDNVRPEDFDNGLDWETGYHDAGTLIVCRDCGHKEQE